MGHALNRTSPKGPGQKFIGTCTKCGTENLPMEAVGWPCENPANLTQDEALILAVEGVHTSHQASLMAALARLDEADANKRITSGDDLAHWEAEYADALEEIAETIDDLGAVECARAVVNRGTGVSVAPAIAKDRADWLLDAVACATQDRRFLRGDPEYDAVAGDAILMNAKKAILVSIAKAGS